MKNSAFAIIAGLLSISVIGWADFAIKENKQFHIRGRALYSFTPEHFVLQTSKYNYKIAKNALSDAVRAELTNAEFQNRNVNVMLPISSIVYLWPSATGTPTKSEEYNRLAGGIELQSKERGGYLNLKGKIIFSFEESYSLVQVNNSIYRLDNLKMNPRQLNEFKKAGFGGGVDLSVLGESIESVWDVRQLEAHVAARPTLNDGVVFSSTGVEVVGSTLLSFNPALTLIESGEMIYQFVKDKLVTDNPEKLSIPGSRVEVVAPFGAIVYAWMKTPSYEVEGNSVNLPWWL